MRPVELFHIGPQKSGTTWVYRCLREHPGVACPPADRIHYFDMFYARGRDWYAAHFEAAQPGQLLFDPTYTYIRSPWAARRIHEENPNARIALCMRHPVERAFSHFWHERKKLRIDYAFEEVLRNYDLFSSWVEPGFYAEHLERFLDHFPRESLLAQRFDDLERDPGGFLSELLAFYGVDPAFEPSVLDQKVNVAGALRTPWQRRLQRLHRRLERLGWRSGAAALARSGLHGGVEAERRAVPQRVWDALTELCAPEIERLEGLLAIDLQEWKTPGSPWRGTRIDDQGPDGAPRRERARAIAGAGR